MSSPLRIHLAPMEGVVDALLRELWTEIGGFDQCYTEFIRVTHQLIPDSVFYRDCPELLRGACTPAGVPVRVQLLGGDPLCLAENAARAVELGSEGVDLNFGCPAPTVNRHDGGATLLQYPERIYRIVERVRAAVPRELPVSAKIRLGFADPDRCLDNAQAIEAGGADQLTVHCRTKKQMYQPPVDWTWIPRIRERVRLRLIVNGDIASLEDFHRCRAETQCSEIMIGRGALSDPWLALRLKEELSRTPDYPALLKRFFHLNQERVSGAFAVARTKQLCRSFCRFWPEGPLLFNELKILRDSAQVAALLDRVQTSQKTAPGVDFFPSPAPDTILI